MKNIDIKGFIKIVFACLLWGSAFPVLKILYKELHITTQNISYLLLIAGFRFLFAGILILFFYIFKYKKFPYIKTKKEGFKYFQIGFFQTCLLYLLFYIGISGTTGIKSSVLSQLGIFYVLILSSIVLKEKITKNKIFGLISGISGVIILNLDNLDNFNTLFEFKFLGEGTLILSGLASSIGTILTKKTSKKYDPIKLNCWQMIFGSILLILLSFKKLQSFNLSFSLFSISLFIYSIFLSSIAFTIWFDLLYKYEVGKISLYKFLIPVFGSILSVIFLPLEKISLFIFFGLVFVVLGIVIINKKIPT